MPKIGPSFASDLAAAGLAGLGVSWDETGIQYGYSELDAPARAKLDAVLAAHDPSKPVPPLTPDAATKLGLMRALRAIGKWDQAKAAIASNAEAQEEWNLAISIKRDDPLTSGIIQALGLTSTDVDSLLVHAAALTA